MTTEETQSLSDQIRSLSAASGEFQGEWKSGDLTFSIRMKNTPHAKVFDVRGWGWLTGGDGLGLSSEAAVERQKAVRNLTILLHNNLDKILEALDFVESLKPKPIADVPTDGTRVLAYLADWIDPTARVQNSAYYNPNGLDTFGSVWDTSSHPSHFIPIEPILKLFMPEK